MVANLLKAGFAVTVFDVEKAKAENLLALGAAWSSSLAAGLENCEVVLTSLPGPSQVTDVYLGDAGILAHAKPGTTFIDTSTSSVELAVQIEEEAKQRGLDFIEAPITNAIDGAARGELAFFIGGDQDCFAKHRPIFDVLGTDFFYTGKPGNGATTKLITNLLWEHDIDSIFAGHYDPSFSLDLCCKDLRLVHEIADKQGTPLTLGSVARSMFEQAKEIYGGDAPELSVARLVEEKMGLLLRPKETVAQKTKTSPPARPGGSSQSQLMAEALKHMPQGVAENMARSFWATAMNALIAPLSLKFKKAER